MNSLTTKGAMRRPGGADTENVSLTVLTGRRAVAGTLAGLVQFVVCHPLDTIKVQLQSRRCPTVMSCIAHARTQPGGLLGLYRGASLPLVLGGLTTGYFFAVNECLRLYLTRLMGNNTPDGGPRLPPWAITGLSATASAPFVVAVSAPIESWKVRRQVGQVPHHATPPLSTSTRVDHGGASVGGSSVAVPSIGSTAGGSRHHPWRPLDSIRCGYRGASMMIVSRAVGYPAYFLGYDFSKRHLTALWQRYVGASAPPTTEGRVLVAEKDVGTTTSGPAPTVVILMSGALGGVCYWLPAYPADAIKTHLQAARIDASQPRVTVRSAYRALLFNNGDGDGHHGTVLTSSPPPPRLITMSSFRFLRLYRGLSVCLSRSVVVNAVMWWTIEKVNDHYR